jgi:hypothetical protein
MIDLVKYIIVVCLIVAVLMTLATRVAKNIAEQYVRDVQQEVSKF